MKLPRSVLRALSGRYLIALSVAVVVMVGGVVAVNAVISSKVAGVKRVRVDVAPAPAQGANYLILGSDTRAFVTNPQQAQQFGSPAQDNQINSDTMMVVHVEPNQKRTLIVSFPRDLWVNVPGQGMAKINSAFSAGPNKTIQTLQADFNIPINHFISVDFQSFESVVNAIGTVPVYFPYAARDQESGLGVLPGCIQLNGAQALSYARSRTLQFFSTTQNQWILADPTADIGRIARQQQFIRELAGIAVARSLQDPLTGNDIVDRVLHYLVFDQNLTKNDVLTLVDDFRSVNPNDTSHLEFETLPWQEGPTQNGADVLYVQQPQDQAILARLRDFSGTDTSGSVTTLTPKQVRVQVADGTGNASLATSALNDLVQKAGFKSGGTGHVSGTVATTQVRYKPGDITQGELLLQYLSPNTQLVEDPSLTNVGVEVVLGKDFSSITIPTGGGSVTSGQNVGAPQATGPNGQDNAGDTYATGSGTGVNPADFGPPAPKGSCR
jgi:LCP family protein required for cell wall assembly